MLIALGDLEQEGAASQIEATFIEQMKRRRTALGLTQGEVAIRAATLGGNMYQQTIAKLESGQRSLKLTEADILARALGTTVHEMLADGYIRHPGLDVKDSIDIGALEAELEEVIVRLRDSSERVDMAEREHAAAAAMERSAQERRATAAAMSAETRERFASLRVYYERLVKQIDELKSAHVQDLRRREADLEAARTNREKMKDNPNVHAVDLAIARIERDIAALQDKINGTKRKQK